MCRQACTHSFWQVSKPNGVQDHYILSPVSPCLQSYECASTDSACQSCTCTSSASTKEHRCASRHKGYHHLAKPAQQHQAAYCAGLGRIDSEAEQLSYISKHWQTQGCRQQRGTCSSGAIQVQQPVCTSVKDYQCCRACLARIPQAAC